MSFFPCLYLIFSCFYQTPLSPVHPCLRLCPSINVCLCASVFLCVLSPLSSLLFLLCRSFCPCHWLLLSQPSVKTPQEHHSVKFLLCPLLCPPPPGQISFSLFLSCYGSSTHSRWIVLFLTSTTKNHWKVIFITQFITSRMMEASIQSASVLFTSDDMLDPAYRSSAAVCWLYLLQSSF